MLMFVNVRRSRVVGGDPRRSQFDLPAQETGFPSPSCVSISGNFMCITVLFHLKSDTVFPYATMPMMRMNRSGVASMALDDLFQLLQWVVSELMQRLHHPTATPDEVTVWVGAPGPRTPPAPAAPEPEAPP